jgi:hypothetical protein
MDTSADKVKCGVYLLALTATLILLLTSFMSTGEMHHNMRITIDSEEICASFDPNICVSPHVINTADCMSAMNPDTCIERLQAWEDHFNSQCSEEIYAYLLCKEAQTCATLKETLEKCEKTVKRPEWFQLPMLPEADWIDADQK